MKEILDKLKSVVQDLEQGHEPILLFVLFTTSTLVSKISLKKTLVF